MTLYRLLRIGKLYIRPAVLYPALLPLLAACAGSLVGETNWDEVTLSPGKTAYYDNSPCRVYFAMPPGSGKYLVTDVGYGRLGEYPPGERVFLGSVWHGRYEFQVQGTDMPPPEFG